MPRADGPHTRNSRPGVIYRGSKKRLERLEPFEELPANFWLLVAVALLMLVLSMALIYQAM
jgi:hypothetical protein